jgi:hypothetical protein
MSGTFIECSKLRESPVIPDSVTNMSDTFSGCRNLFNAPVIPNSVTNMCGTFFDCDYLSGDIFIQSNKIINAYECFYGTYLDKNVYIPFTYDNGVNTQTYNSFSSSYGSGQNRVTLMDINELNN